MLNICANGLTQCSELGSCSAVSLPCVSCLLQGGKDMTEEISPDLVPVLPVFARSVASDLRAAFVQESVWQDPPYDLDSLPGPSGMPGSTDSFAMVDYDVADAQLCRALKVSICLLRNGLTTSYPRLLCNLSASGTHMILQGNSVLTIWQCDRKW